MIKLKENKKMEKTTLDKIFFVFDCIFAIIWLVFCVKNLVIGINNHDTYYLVSAIVDYGFMRLNTNSIKKYLDIED